MDNNDSDNKENMYILDNFNRINNNYDNDNDVNDNYNYEDSESIKYYEGGAHFRYKDLFNSLLKLKKEKEKETEKEKEKINNIIINNKLNLNLFNNKHKIISRNVQMNNYLNNLNNLNFFENSNITNTFISNISNRQLNKTAMLPSTEMIEQKINNYLDNQQNNKKIMKILKILLIIKKIW